MMSDRELLRAFAEQGDEAAFAEVVRLQASFVYSVALRVCRNPHLAEDVTQAVFSKMARKAAKLSQYRSLAGWLHTTARHGAIDAVRNEARRRTRDQEAALMQSDHNHPEADWAEIGPVLDEAVDQLGDRDRHAVLLRFFHGQSHQEIGQTLGLSENAANKCVERALKKLRTHFARRGVVISSALLATAISEHSVQAAPVGVVERITPPALAQAGVAGTAGFALFTFMSTNIKSTLAIAAITALVVAVGFCWYAASTPPGTNRTASANPAGTSPPAVAKPVVSAPVAAPVTPLAAKPAASAAPAPASGPEAELNSTMDEIIAVLQTGDEVTAFNRFIAPDFLASMPPDIKAGLEQSLKDQQSTPEGKKTLQQMIAALQSMKAQAPDLNSASTRATYQVADPTDDGDFPPVIHFQKTNGKWYVMGF